MHWLWLLSYFFGGAFVGNAVPHFVAGTMGRSFQTPFAKPPGKGLSSSTVNVVWGFSNAVADISSSRTLADFIRGRQPTSSRLGWACCSLASRRRTTSASFMGARHRLRHDPGRQLRAPEIVGTSGIRLRARLVCHSRSSRPRGQLHDHWGEKFRRPQLVRVSCLAEPQTLPTRCRRDL